MRARSGDRHSPCRKTRLGALVQPLRSRQNSWPGADEEQQPEADPFRDLGGPWTLRKSRKLALRTMEDHPTVWHVVEKRYRRRLQPPISTACRWRTKKKIIF
ncbi:hypothetical protein ACFX1Q_007765 [Malus domestica]